MYSDIAKLFVVLFCFSMISCKSVRNENCSMNNRSAKIGSTEHRADKIKARITVYWSEGKGSDYYTRKGISSTGEMLVHKRSAAVDPRIIPYGSEIQVPNFGVVKAVDTGGAVISKTASRKLGYNYPVVDLYFRTRKEALKWANQNPLFLEVTIL